MDDLLRHLEEERQKALEEWLSDTSSSYWKGYAFAMLDVIVWFNSHMKELDINYIERDKVKEAYRKIEERMHEQFRRASSVEHMKGYQFQEALEIMEEECPEVLEECK